MNFWKWSNGETYYQSPRKYREKETETTINHNMNYDSSINAIEQSLAEPTDIIPNHMLSKRETLDTKMSDRELISQRGVNPFSAQTSYVNDVVTRDMFLKPINTTQGRTKNQNKGEDE
jgi:hypothetical protein